MSFRFTAGSFCGLFFLMLMLFSFQLSASPDSTAAKKVRLKAIYDVSYQRHDVNAFTGIDTSIFQLHRNDFVNRDGAEYFHLGNVGTAAFPIIFQPGSQKDFGSGFSQFNIYGYNRDSIRYYNAQRPYTELSYIIGLKKEQVFRGRFFHSTKVGFDYGVDFFRINSTGSYAHQNALDAGFYLYAKYHPKNQRWNVYTDLLFNQYKVAENSGLQGDFFANDTSFFQKSLVPVNNTTAVNNYREWTWALGMNYNLGKKVKQQINDTTIIQKVIPRFRIGYEFSLQSNRYKFLDTQPDSLFYGEYFYLRDSLKNQFDFFKAGNSISFTWMPQRITSDSTYKEQLLTAGGIVNLDYWYSKTNNGKSPFVNGSVEGFVKSNTAFKTPIHFEGRVKYFFSGYNRNDLVVNGNIRYTWKNYLSVKAYVLYSLTEPGYTQQYFNVKNGAGWNNNFGKQNQLTAGGTVYSPKIGMGAEVYNTILQNFIYYNSDAKPQQLSSTLNVFVVHAYNRFAIKGFHLDNDVWFQKASGTDVIRLPLFVSKHSVYYENRLFKKNLWFAIGCDLRYYTSFFANAYNPLVGQFYLQDNKKMAYAPVWDVFLNVKIRTVRVSLLGSDLTQLIQGRPHYNGYLYPAKDASFRFFVTWRFLE